MATDNPRKAYLDTACGLLILHMIVGHCCIFSGFSPEYQKFTLVIDFFMPWFFFKSGMFFRDQPVKEAVKDIWHRLMIPYIVFSVIALILGLMVECILCGESTVAHYLSAQADNILNDGAVVWEAALWFLTSLAAVRLIFLLCNKLGKAGYVIILSICLAGIYIDGFMGLHSVPLYVRNIPLGLIFYSLGHLIEEARIIGRYSAVVVTVAYLILLAICPTYLDFHQGFLAFGSFWLYFPITILGIVSINSLLRCFYDRNCLLSRIGRDSMAYYILHWPIIMSLKYVFVYLGIPTERSVAYIASLLCAEAMLLPLLIYLIRRFHLSIIFGERASVKYAQ